MKALSLQLFVLSSKREDYKIVFGVYRGGVEVIVGFECAAVEVLLLSMYCWVC